MKSSPALMVPCRVCGSKAGYACHKIYPYRGMGEKVRPHLTRLEDYKLWVEGLSNNGFVKREQSHGDEVI